MRVPPAATRSRPVAGVAARTDATVVGLALLGALTTGDAVAAPPRTKAVERRGPTIEDLYLRFTLFLQDGTGFQSKAGPAAGPGSQELVVMQPMGQLGLRGADRRWSHQFNFALDVVTAASPDGLDAVSSASRYNEAGEIDATHAFESRDRGAFAVRYGVHFEEPFRSGFVGFGWSQGFFEDNTTVAVNSTYVLDVFDYIHPLGWSPVRQETRLTIGDTLSWTQVLSPTTLMSLNYGFTFQSGTLETTWNSVAIADAPVSGCANDLGQAPEYDCINREPERLPKTRTRHALAATIAQHVPRTRTTFKVGYRFYDDDFELRAHTPSVMAYQWMGRRFYVRGMYRYHWQRGVSFYTVATRTDFSEHMPLSADSDLAPFTAHQWGAKAVLYLVPPRSLRGAQSLDIGYSRYQRSNDLHIDVVSVGYARDF